MTFLVINRGVGKIPYNVIDWLETGKNVSGRLYCQ